MATTQIQQDYAKLLMAYLAKADNYKPLEDFIKPLKLEDLLDCVSTYFDVTSGYGENRKEVLIAFYDLMSTAIAKGDVYFALRFESLTQRKDMPWGRRHAALDSTYRKRLAAQVKQKKASLSPTQRRFLEKFSEYMKQPDQKMIEKFVSALKFQPLYDCLLSYIEVSQQFSDDDANSLIVFYGMSLRALGLGDSYFAAKYESQVRSDGSVWKRRYDALKSWQRENYLEPAIKEKKMIVSVTKYKDKDVTQKQPISVDIPALPAQPEDQRSSQPQTAVQREFVKSFHEYMGRQGKDKRDVAFTESIFHMNFDALRQCVHAYLEASTRYPDDNKRSLYIFVGVGARAIAMGDAYYALKFKLNINQAGTIWAKRFDALDQWGKDQINNEIKKKENRARIIDDLKFAYFQKHRKEPNIQSLRNFEIAINEEQGRMLSNILEKLSYTFKSHDVADFIAAFDALYELLKAHKDPILTYGLIQRCSRETSLNPIIRYQIRWFMIGELYLHVLPKRPEVYQRGFDQEERAFLFDDADRRNEYFDDYVFRLDYLWKEHPDVDKFTKLSKADALLHIAADQFAMRLVPLAEAAAVHGFVEALRKKNADFLYKIRIPVKSRHDRGVTLKINQTIGKVFIIWWDPNGRGEAYLEVEGFEGILFGANSYDRLGQIYDDDATWGEIARNTQHILVLMPVFFELLGYLPDLVTGGLSGLAKAYFFNLALEKTSHALGLDSTAAQFILLGVGMLAHHAVPGEKKVAAPGLEAEASALENKGIRRLTGDTSATNRHIDNPSVTRTGATDSHIPSDRRSGVDMRGIEKDEGHLIRGEADVAAEIPSGAADQHISSKSITNNGVSGKGVSPGATTEPPAPAITRQDLARAEERLKEVKSNFEKARLEMEQKKDRVGTVEAQVEGAKNERFKAARQEELESAKQAEKQAIAAYRKSKQQLTAVEAQVARYRADLAKRGELEKSLGDKWNLPDTPKTFRRGNVEADSWLPDAYVGTSRDRAPVERILNEDPGGDLSRFLLQNNQLFPANVGNMAHWKANPQIIEMAHVLSRREGGREVTILMTKARNQTFSANLERTGGIFLDEAIVIQRIAVDRMSALEWVKKGWLPQSVVDKARVIKF
jgi:hypothetical protein